MNSMRHRIHPEWKKYFNAYTKGLAANVVEKAKRAPVALARGSGRLVGEFAQSTFSHMTAPLRRAVRRHGANLVDIVIGGAHYVLSVTIGGIVIVAVMLLGGLSALTLYENFKNKID